MVWEQYTHNSDKWLPLIPQSQIWFLSTTIIVPERAYIVVVSLSEPHIDSTYVHDVNVHTSPARCHRYCTCERSIYSMHVRGYMKEIFTLFCPISAESVMRDHIYLCSNGTSLQPFIADMKYERLKEHRIRDRAKLGTKTVEERAAALQ